MGNVVYLEAPSQFARAAKHCSFTPAALSDTRGLTLGAIIATITSSPTPCAARDTYAVSVQVHCILTCQVKLCSSMLESLVNMHQYSLNLTESYDELTFSTSVSKAVRVADLTREC